MAFPRNLWVTSEEVEVVDRDACMKALSEEVVVVVIGAACMNPFSEVVVVVVVVPSSCSSL